MCEVCTTSAIVIGEAKTKTPQIFQTAKSKSFSGFQYRHSFQLVGRPVKIEEYL